MAIVSKGYAGTIDYADWAVLTDRLGSQYSVFDPGAWMASAGGGTREVVIQPGAAAGKGIYDVSDAAVTLSGASVASGNRWDMIVLRRKWTAPAGTSLVLIQGNANRALPSREMTPGVLDDHPLWLVRFSAGQAAPQEFVDLRVWHGDGGCVAKDILARSVLTRIGSRVYIQGITWVYGFNVSGTPTWFPDSVYVSATQPPYFDNLAWIKVP